VIRKGQGKHVPHPDVCFGAARLGNDGQTRGGVEAADQRAAFAGKPHGQTTPTGDIEIARAWPHTGLIKQVDILSPVQILEQIRKLRGTSAPTRIDVFPRHGSSSTEVRAQGSVSKITPSEIHGSNYVPFLA